MLKQIISYINYKELCKNSDDFDDFIRNVLANVISNPKKNRRPKPEKYWVSL